MPPLSPALPLAALLLVSACASADDPAATGRAATAGSSASSQQIDHDQDAIKAQLRQSVAAYRDLLPLQVHENGALVRMTTYDLVLEFTFKFGDKRLSSDSQNSQFAAAVAKTVMTGLSCGNPRITKWLEQNVIFRYRFIDQDNAPFLEHDLNQAACEARD